MHDDALFISEPGIVFSVTRRADRDDDLEGFGSELRWASVPEIRLWGAITLSIPEGEGVCHVYPSQWAETLDPFNLPSLSLTDRDCLQEFRDIARQLTVDRFRSRNCGPYQTHQRSGDVRVQQKLYAALSPRSPLLIRGASCLMKGWALWSHDIFGEEATMSLYIAMEAALRFIRQGLSEQRGRQVSFAETHAFLAETLHLGEPLSEYLKKCWDNRIMLVHPDSDMGCYTIPPLLADDFYETYEALVGLYRFILINEDRPQLLTAR